VGINNNDHITANMESCNNDFEVIAFPEIVSNRHPTSKNIKAVEIIKQIVFFTILQI